MHMSSEIYFKYYVPTVYRRSELSTHYSYMIFSTVSALIFKIDPHKSCGVNCILAIFLKLYIAELANVKTIIDALLIVTFQIVGNHVLSLVFLINLIMVLLFIYFFFFNNYSQCIRNSK